MQDPNVIWQVPIGVVVLFTLRGVGDYIVNYFPSWVGRQIIKTLRHDLFQHYMRLPIAYSDQQQSGDLLSKLTNNIELVAAAATNAAISLISDSLSIMILVGYLFFLNWKLAAFSLASHRDRVADADRQPQFSPLQPAHSTLDGRYHARGEGSHRCAALDKNLQRRGASDAALQRSTNTTVHRT